jgi:hypothetical protein
MEKISYNIKVKNNVNKNVLNCEARRSEWSIVNGEW